MLCRTTNRLLCLYSFLRRCLISSVYLLAMPWRLVFPSFHMTTGACWVLCFLLTLSCTSLLFHLQPLTSIFPYLFAPSGFKVPMIGRPCGKSPTLLWDNPSLISKGRPRCPGKKRKAEADLSTNRNTKKDRDRKTSLSEEQWVYQNAKKSFSAQWHRVKKKLFQQDHYQNADEATRASLEEATFQEHSTK